MRMAAHIAPPLASMASGHPIRLGGGAEELRQIVRAGGDPLTEKRTLKQSPTVSDLLDAYLLSESFEDKSEQTQKVDLGRIERHLRPLLGKRHAHLLTDNDIKKALTAIREGKTATKDQDGLAWARQGDRRQRHRADGD